MIVNGVDDRVAGQRAEENAFASIRKATAETGVGCKEELFDAYSYHPKKKRVDLVLRSLRTVRATTIRMFLQSHRDAVYRSCT